MGFVVQIRDARDHGSGIRRHDLLLSLRPGIRHRPSAGHGVHRSFFIAAEKGVVVIVLFTDFGLAGPYTGQVKAVLQQAAPGIPVVDLFADAPVGNPKAAAYLLAAYGAWFPAGTVFLCVVDPGVGGIRPPVIVEADGRTFVGPGNDLFEIVLRRADRARIWEIAWQPPRLSATFHGRDLFAPVAAMLARGEPVPGVSRDPAWARQPGWPDDLAEIVHIDHYGNAMTGLRAGSIPTNATLSVGGRTVTGARTFGDRPRGAALWYENANGLVEIAVNQGRADRTLRLAIGTPVLPGRSGASKAPRPKPQKQTGKPPPGGNKRLADQTRRILGKHYANKYGVK
jgi:S-adenosylmethionine hydrolase